MNFCRVLSTFAVLLLLGACGRAPESAAPAPTTAAPAVAPAIEVSTTERSLIEQVCATLHALPNARKKDCCGHDATDLSAVCVATLSAALPQGGIALKPQAIAACASASAASLTGCNWVTPLLPEPPAACTGVVTGSLDVGASCQSSLACADGQYCRGMGPGIAGRCAQSEPAGGACETPNDNLASMLRAQDDPKHRSCQGLCLRGRCLAVAQEGGQCVSTAFCADGLSCVAGLCSSQTLSQAGAACDASNACAAGLICGSGHCAAPKIAGASCALPFECRSLACEKSPGAQLGVCADACGNPAAPLKLAGLPL
jgi:hypothetical protein